MISGLNSLVKLFIINFIDFEIWFGINQKVRGKIINQENINNQFIDKYKDVEGSKMEKRLVIILLFF